MKGVNGVVLKTIPPKVTIAHWIKNYAARIRMKIGLLRKALKILTSLAPSFLQVISKKIVIMMKALNINVKWRVLLVGSAY